MPHAFALSPRLQRLAGAGLALAMAMALVLGSTAEAAAPEIAIGGSTPLPAPFRRALPSYGPGSVASISYKALVFGRLAAANHVGEKTNAIPGVAGLHFSIGADGALVALKVVRTSGNPVFDANALAMVRKAAPFPPPPLGAEREFDATIKFNPTHRP